MSFNNGPKIVTSGLQTCIDFSDKNCYSGTGTTFNNLVPNGNIGYLKNNVTFSTSKGGIVATGGYNSGAIYNVGDRIDINTVGAGIDRFGANSFSMFFWVNQQTSYGRILSTGSAGAGTGNSDQCIWQLWCDTGQFYWWNSGGGGTNNISAAGTWHTPYTWQLVGFTYSYNEGGNDIVRCYTNGVEQFNGVTSTASHSYVDRSGETIMQWTLGGGYSSSCYNTNSACNFGTFYLYNKKLSVSEIQQIFNATKSRFI